MTDLIVHFLDERPTVGYCRGSAVDATGMGNRWKILNTHLYTPMYKCHHTVIKSFIVITYYHNMIIEQYYSYYLLLCVVVAYLQWRTQVRLGMIFLKHGFDTFCVVIIIIKKKNYYLFSPLH